MVNAIHAAVSGNQLIDFYVNGTLLNSGIITGTINIPTVYAGIMGFADFGPVPTLFREGYFFNHALSASEVTNITNNNKAFYSVLSFPAP